MISTLDSSSQTTASSSILWSASWLTQAWRITALPNGLFRVTASRQSQRGHVELTTAVFPDISDAWRRLAAHWLTDTELIYNAAEKHFRVEILGFSQGRPGFRQGAPVLRRRAEKARDDLFLMARSCGRDWLSLKETAGNTLENQVIPEWLSNALDDLAQPDLAIPPLDHWLVDQR